MIVVSQKTLYAMRGIFELAKRAPRSATAAEISEAQAIPQRFLELIFNELRQSGFVKSHRGPHGGYVLAREGSKITMGDILRAVEGPISLVKCAPAGRHCPTSKACPLGPTWDRAAKAMENVFNQNTIQAMVDKQIAMKANPILEYSI